MNVGVIGAISEETSYIEKKLQDVTYKNIFGVRLSIGTIGQSTFYVVTSGVGKVNAAMAATVLCVMYPIDTLVNIGVAGGYRLKPKDVVIADSTLYHDFDTTAVGDPKGFVTGPDFIELYTNNRLSTALFSAAEDYGLHTMLGVVATGDQFIASESKCKEIADEFRATAIDMECAAIAHVCNGFKNNIKFGAVKLISDRVDSSAASDYSGTKLIAGQLLANIVLDAIDNIESGIS